MEDIKNCNLCEICINHKPINGVGNVNADIMFVLSKPNYYTVKHNDIFKSEIGKLIHKLLNMITIDVEDVYITHLVKGRSLTIKKKNILACKPYLKDEIDFVKPKIIVTMGFIPNKVFLKSNIPLSNHIGKAYLTNEGSYVLPMYDLNFIFRDVRYHHLAIQDFANLYKLYKEFVNPNIVVFEDNLHSVIKKAL